MSRQVGRRPVGQRLVGWLLEVPRKRDVLLSVGIVSLSDGGSLVKEVHCLSLHEK